MKKMTFHSAAIMPRMAERGLASYPQETQEPYYPQIYLGEDALPEAKEWTMGEEYTIVLKVRQVSQNLDGQEKINTGFDIESVAVYDEEKE